jgi:two-component system response regulator YesN
MSSRYKVFLAEDEIVTREGIRDNVNWAAAGFEFCGEAPDGEMALPLILATQPDVLITDIKMPFMDGLELSRLVRERLPGIKIIILSGHDEFQYAQQAIKLGVTEYLLKPIGVQDLAQVLRKVAAQIEKENADREQLQGLQHQVADSLLMQREKFLLWLLTEEVGTSEALEKARPLGLDLVSQFFQIVFLQVEGSHGESIPANYASLQNVNEIVTGLVEQNPDVILFKKDMDEFVLILKNKDKEQIRQDAYYLAETIREQVVSATQCLLEIGLSQPRERIGELAQAFAQAMQNARLDVVAESGETQTALLQIDDTAILEYLKFGDPAGFDAFFEKSVSPLGGVQNRIFLDYIIINTMLVTARHIRALGGDPAQLLPDAGNLENLPLKIRKTQDARAYLRSVMLAALEFRDRQANRQSASLIQKAKDYIGANFTNAELSLADVARHIGLSASHFSFIFSRETDQTFKDYLTGLRIERARELLRSTDLSSSEISEQVGYNDPHYFSTVFKKVTTLTPREFRSQKG